MIMRKQQNVNPQPCADFESLDDREFVQTWVMTVIDELVDGAGVRRVSELLCAVRERYGRPDAPTATTARPRMRACMTPELVRIVRRCPTTVTSLELASLLALDADVVRKARRGASYRDVPQRCPIDRLRCRR